MKTNYNYTGNASFERAYHDCKLVADSIVDAESFQAADTGLLLYHMDRILEALERQVKKKIYIVEIHDYDGCESKGYFTEYEKAYDCSVYLNRKHPSPYGIQWCVKEYNLDEIDYDSLNKELDEKERLKLEAELEKIKQEELAELARLKAKYGQD